ncbi:thioredoxin domain-containing protein [Azohydromonas lata]|uniref:Hydrogenase n=1 Tax=Azohydromonas lata TaxID=45677 RepID=A0ABU5IR74_9BURK|nr:hydrogenase [Azohydromonas lata]MDZ5461387.1 hydrogenase [Azohydromonas lata]
MNQAVSGVADSAAPNLSAEPDTPAVIASLVQRHGAQWVDERTLDDWIHGGGDRVLLLAGDPVRFPEGLDVAVVLPEILRAMPGRFAMGVARRSAEGAVAQRLGANRWPSLVFVRDGRYVSTLAGMHDWNVFVTRVQEILAMEPTRIPGIGIAVVSADAGAGCA